MTGKYAIEIGWKEFLDGCTSSPEAEDGGFSSQTNSANLTSSSDTLGVLYPTAFASDKSTNLNGNIIAAVSDPDSGVGVNKYILTATGRFISADSSSALTVRRTTGGGKTYSFPNSDIAVYKNALYATSAADVTKSTGANLVSTFDESWWDTTLAKSALSTGVRHPLLVFEDYLWIGDGNKLHRTNGTTGDEGFLTLNDGLVITSLGVDPSSGLMLIAASEGANGSDTLPRQSKIYMYDGFSTKPRKAVIVDDMVTEIYPLGGTVYMFYGQNIGYWNGSGITFLRKLRSVGLAGTQLVYKHRVTNIGKTLLIADGEYVLALEDTLAGKKRWNYLVNFAAVSFNAYLDAIFNMGNNVLGIGYDSNGSTPAFAVLDVSSRAAGIVNFYSRRYKFQRPVTLREIIIEYNDEVAASGRTGTVTFYNETFSAVTGPVITNDSSSGTYVIKRPLNYNTDFRTFQLYYNNSADYATVAGIRRFIVSYDVAE